MERYDSYKDSGVQWLGEIPSHWEVNRFGSYFTERRVKVSDKDYAPLSVTKNGILPQLENVAKSNDSNNRKLVKAGDFVINSRSDRKGSSGVSSLDGSVSLINIVLKPRKGIVPAFCNYLLKSYCFIEEYYRNGRGIVADLWTTRFDEMKLIKLAVPTIDEQNAMVAHLDAATSKIDEAIAQQQKMIDLLKERKQIIINNAVTKGLNPNVKMKDSGVEWIGEIPEHWTVIALKRLGSINKTLVNPQNRPEMSWYEYSMPAYDDGKFPNMVLGSNIDSTKISLTQPTLLINKLNVHKKRIWFVSCPEENSVASTEFVPITITKGNPFFVEYILKSDKITTFLINNSNGATNSHKRVSPDIIMGIKIPLPPEEEQSDIVEYINSIIAPIDMATDNCNKQISLLQERKQIIINEVVTGKVKVS